MGCGVSSESGYPRMSQVRMDEAALASYVQIEREIAEAEAKNPLRPLDLKSEQLSRLSEREKQLEQKLQQLKRQTVKEKSDVDQLTANRPSDTKVKDVIMKLGSSFNEEVAKENEEYVAALNREEITSKELEEVRRQRREITSEMEQLEKEADRLQNLYKKQDEFLDRIFGDKYGSVLENRLELELDHLEAQRGRILEANFKWRQGLMMLEYACKQLAIAVQKWQDLPNIPQLDVEIRYAVAAETRNNVVAAGQNISGAQRYLEKVDFPYCDPSEVATLNKAAQYIFTDMQSPERHQHANQCYVTCQKRANALLQWFDTVINTTIMKDLHEINERVKEKTLELRRERVRLIKERIREMYGREVQLDQTLRGREISTDEIARAMITDKEIFKLNNESEMDNVSLENMLEADELAPVPNNSVIFGSMYDNYQTQLENLRKQHQEELEMFMKEQESNQQRIKSNLEEKLMTRRKRRARMKIENAERSAFVNNNNS